MKFECLSLSVFRHFILCYNNCKRCFIVISNSCACTEQIVCEVLSPLLQSHRAGKGDCDVTGRDPKS